MPVEIRGRKLVELNDVKASKSGNEKKVVDHLLTLGQLEVFVVTLVLKHQSGKTVFRFPEEWEIQRLSLFIGVDSWISHRLL